MSTRRGKVKTTHPTEPAQPLMPGERLVESVRKERGETFVQIDTTTMRRIETVSSAGATLTTMMGRLPDTPDDRRPRLVYVPPEHDPTNEKGPRHPEG